MHMVPQHMYQDYDVLLFLFLLTVPLSSNLITLNTVSQNNSDILDSTSEIKSKPKSRRKQRDLQLQVWYQKIDQTSRL